MPISYPTNCRLAGARQISFEIDSDGLTIYGAVTCEAVLGMPSAAIRAEDELRALKLVERDHSIAREVAARARYGGVGKAGLPVILSSIDFTEHTERA